jgi:hypothetical protein
MVLLPEVEYGKSVDYGDVLGEETEEIMVPSVHG